MKTKAIYLTTTLALTTALLSSNDLAADNASGESLYLRYGDGDSSATLSVNQDISTTGHDSIAARTFQLGFEINGANDAVMFNISKARGSYTAHDMTQRLPASGLKGQSFSLAKVDDGRALQRTDSEQKLEIGLGQMVGLNYPVGLALADVLPALPESPVGVGSTWISNRDTSSLEGWAWTVGSLSTEHAVTAIEQLDGHSIVSVTSTAHAQLTDIESGIRYSGDGVLSRTSHWRFDATDGKLLSISMRQSTSGQNTLPQGTIEVKQLTVVEFSVLQGG
jgi:hypothetical protein